MSLNGIKDKVGVIKPESIRYCALTWKSTDARPRNLSLRPGNCCRGCWTASPLLVRISLQVKIDGQADTTQQTPPNGAASAPRVLAWLVVAACNTNDKFEIGLSGAEVL